MLRILGLFAAMLLVAALSACGSLSGLIAPASATARPAWLEPIFVASVRALEPDGSFGNGRSPTISYAAYDVSVPPTHQPSESPRYSALRLDASRDFVVANSRTYEDADAFNAAVRVAGAAPGEALVYVHGFNTDYDDSIYQLAQIGADIDLPATRVLFAWPAQTKLRGYMHDLDSAGFARDSLERVLDGLAASGMKRIVVVGYSMGASLVVETLRQMKLTGSPQFFSHLGGVVLLSPDMDVDVFRADAKRMGGLPQPFVIYAAPSLGPLRVIADIFAAGQPRLGGLADPQSLADVELTFVDVTNVPSSRQPGHLPVATAPSMIADLNAMPRPDLVRYAQGAAKGAIPGAEIRRFGKFTYVLLPKP